MNELVFVEDIKIENMIYEFRGKFVMLDSDLSKLYCCKNGTKCIISAVKRNMNKFPDDFYFQITKEEFGYLKSHFVTSSWNNYGGIRKMPHVFTEEGVAMLASVLKTEVASRVSVNIMRAFIKMRKFITINNNFSERISNLETKYIEHDTKIDILFDKLSR